jgi:hypothetical protein
VTLYQSLHRWSDFPFEIRYTTLIRSRRVCPFLRIVVPTISTLLKVINVLSTYFINCYIYVSSNKIYKLQETSLGIWAIHYRVQERISIVGWGTMPQVARSWVRFLTGSLFFFHFTQSFQPHYGPGVNSASNRNEYQGSSWGGKGRPVLKADILIAICDLSVRRMWNSPRLTTLCASTAC